MQNNKSSQIGCRAFYIKPSENVQVNHRDGNKLNNIVSNLEWVTPAENIAHSIKNETTQRLKNPRGAYRNQRKIENPWISVIQLNGKRKNLGSFPTKKDAYEAYRIAFRELYGFEPW